MSAALIQRIATAQLHAAALGHVGVFATLTVPSSFRRHPATPAEAQRWLQVKWAKARAAAARRDARVYGVRLAEPQSDGTPHWHVLAFLPTQTDAATFTQAICRNVCGEANTGNAGAMVLRPLAEGIAASLLSKHVEKAADDRVKAWYASWGIRPAEAFGLVYGEAQP